MLSGHRNAGIAQNSHKQGVPAGFKDFPSSGTIKVGIYSYKMPNWEAESGFCVKQPYTLGPSKGNKNSS